MKIDLKQMKFIPICIMALVLIQVVVSFTVFSFLQSISLVVWGLCILAWMLVAVLYARQSEMTPYGFLWAAYFMVLITSTLLSATSLKQLSYVFVDCTLFLMLMFYYKQQLSSLLLSCNITLSAIIYVNFIIMVLFPNWMFSAKDTFDSFLLGGNYNQMGGRLLCGIVTSLLCVKMNKRWIINAIMLIIVAIATLALVGSMTALTGLIVFVLLCLIPSFRLQKIALLSFFAFYVLFQVFVCFNGEGLHNNELANYIIVDLLGKDITFTHRTMMWDLASKLFVRSPLIGYGCVDSEWYTLNMTSFAIGPHNFVYGQLINGGLVIVMILIASSLVVIRKVRQSFDRMLCILCAGLCSLLFMMLMEVYPVFFFLYLLTWIFYYPELCNSLNPQLVANSPKT